MIEIRELRRGFGSVQALRGVTFTVGRGESVGFLGQNGAGKTTTMRVLAGLLAADSGEVRFRWTPRPGPSLPSSTTNEWTAPVRRRLGYLPEHPAHYEHLTVREQVRLFGTLNALRGEELTRATERSLAMFDLRDVADSRVAILSKGTRQRAALARTLVHDPEILLLDEPFSGLDPVQRLRLRDSLMSLAATRTTLLSSHSLPEIEPLCSRILVLRDGIIAHETTAKGGMLRLRVRRASADLEAALRGLDGVSEVRALDEPAAYELIAVDGDALREEISATCWRIGAGLVELAVQSALKDIERLFRNPSTPGDA